MSSDKDFEAFIGRIVTITGSHVHAGQRGLALYTVGSGDGINGQGGLSAALVIRFPNGQRTFVYEPGQVVVNG